MHRVSWDRPLDSSSSSSSSSRRVASGVMRGRGSGRGMGSGNGKPLRVRVLPYMVKKAGIGRGCPTLIGHASIGGGAPRNNESVHIIHRDHDRRLHSVFGARIGRRCGRIAARNLYILGRFFFTREERKSAQSDTYTYIYIIFRNCRCGIRER